MRKVYVSTMMVNRLEPTKYSSEDYTLVQENLQFPLSYIIADTVEPGDTVQIITVVSDTMQPKKNYEIYCREVTEIVACRGAKAEFTMITQPPSQFNAHAVNVLFKRISEAFITGDRIYADMTFGMKPNTIALFIALHYVTKVGTDIVLEEMIYAERYRGDAVEGATTGIYDLTGLYYLNAIAGKLESSSAQGMTDVLDAIIEEE